MNRYLNRSGKTGVAEYAIGIDFLDVKFKGREEVYRYSERSAGREQVAAMKVLAVSGRGLSTFISQAQPGYER